MRPATKLAAFAHTADDAPRIAVVVAAEREDRRFMTKGSLWKVGRTKTRSWVYVFKLTLLKQGLSTPACDQALAVHLRLISGL